MTAQMRTMSVLWNKLRNWWEWIMRWFPIDSVVTQIEYERAANDLHIYLSFSLSLLLSLLLFCAPKHLPFQFLLSLRLIFYFNLFIGVSSFLDVVPSIVSLFSFILQSDFPFRVFLYSDQICNEMLEIGFVLFAWLQLQFGKRNAARSRFFVQIKQRL